MKRVSSESRLPGMTSNRRCQCGTLLTGDGEQCIDCRPTLSARAREIGDLKRLREEEVRNAQRQIESLDNLLRKLKRRIK
jgi:hypothetical protein